MQNKLVDKTKKINQTILPANLEKAASGIKFTILINAAPYTNQGAQTAYLFAKAVLNQGHHIQQIFFYYDGIHNGNAFYNPPTDEINLTNCWQQLQSDYDLKLIICVAAAARRGMDETIINSSFKLAGLGELLAAVATTDRLITFN